MMFLSHWELAFKSGFGGRSLAGSHSDQQSGKTAQPYLTMQ
jgi:hypothetical protein